MKQNRAIFYMIFSVFGFAVMNAIVKYLTEFNVYQIVFFRSIGTLAFTLPLLLKYKIPMFGNHKKLLFLRGFLGVISLTCFIQSLNYLPVGTAVSLRYTSPIFAAIFALFFLKEKIKILQWFLFILAFIGVLLIKGFGEQVDIIGLTFVIISAVSLGLIFIVIRKLGALEVPLVIVNTYMLLAFFFGGIMSLQYWKQPNLIELILLSSLGVFGYVGQIYMTKAFQSDETSVIAPLKYLEVVFTILIGAFWFEEVYSVITLLGVFLILIGLVYNIYLKKKQ